MLADNGTNASLHDSAEDCLACLPGSYSSAGIAAGGAAACSPCLGSRMFQDEYGASRCKMCPTEFVVSNRSTKCGAPDADTDGGAGGDGGRGPGTDGSNASVALRNAGSPAPSGNGSSDPGNDSEDEETSSRLWSLVLAHPVWIILGGTGACSACILVIWCCGSRRRGWCRGGKKTRRTTGAVVVHPQSFTSEQRASMAWAPTAVTPK